jgi:hypothetical protein
MEYLCRPRNARLTKCRNERSEGIQGAGSWRPSKNVEDWFIDYPDGQISTATRALSSLYRNLDKIRPFDQGAITDNKRPGQSWRCSIPVSLRRSRSCTMSAHSKLWPGGGKAILEFLAQDEGEERAEDVAAGGHESRTHLDHYHHRSGVWAFGEWPSAFRDADDGAPRPPTT